LSLAGLQRSLQQDGARRRLSLVTEGWRRDDVARSREGQRHGGRVDGSSGRILACVAFALGRAQRRRRYAGFHRGTYPSVVEIAIAVGVLWNQATVGAEEHVVPTGIRADEERRRGICP